MTPCVCYDVCLLMCDVWRPSSAPLFVRVKKQMTQIKSNRWRCKQITDQTHFNFCFRNNDRKWKHSWIPSLFIFVADLFIFYPPFFRNFQTWNLILQIINQIEHISLTTTRVAACALPRTGWLIGLHEVQCQLEDDNFLYSNLSLRLLINTHWFEP